jgi:drug/metabolite transporter (DMT)-like permease
VAKVVTRTLPGDQVAFLRFALMLTPFAVSPALVRRALEVQRVDLLVYRGIFGGTAVLLYFLAIEHVPVGTATLLNYSSPVWAVLFAGVFLGERVEQRLLAPLAIALIGVFLVSGVSSRGLAEFRIGPWETAGLLSSVLSGAAVTAIRAARRTEGSWAIYGSFTLFGLLATAPFGLAGFKAPSPREWLLIAAVGVLSVIAQLLMTWAYRWLTNLQAGVMAQLTVVVSMLVGVLWLGDRLTGLQVVGSLLTLSGILGVVWMQSTPRAVE